MRILRKEFDEKIWGTNNNLANMQGRRGGGQRGASAPLALHMKEQGKQNISFKPRPNALDFSLYIARQMSSIVECCREGVAKRSRLFTRFGTQHSTDVLFDE